MIVVAFLLVVAAAFFFGLLVGDGLAFAEIAMRVVTNKSNEQWRKALADAQFEKQEKERLAE